MNPSVVLYSDCPIFGGAENLVVNILQHSTLPDEFGIHFVYRHNPHYVVGLERSVTKPVPMTAIRFPDRLEWIDAMEHRVPSLTLQWLWKAFFRLVEPGLFFYAAFLIWREFRRLRPEIVQINDGGYPGSLGCRAAALAATLAGARSVIFNVNSAAKPLKLPNAIFEPLFDRIVIACSDIFVTASQFAGRALAARGFPEDRIAQVPNSTPIPRPTRQVAALRGELGLGPEDVAFAVIAYFGPWKGHPVLVDAVARLKKDRPEDIARLRLLMIGEGPDLEMIKELVRELGVERHFKFLGFRGDAMELLHASDGLILPSVFWKGVSEDMPYCILEAMALSKPVVASRLSGIAETVVDEETGLLVPQGEAAPLADAIVRVLRDPALRARLGARGSERFLERYETGQTAKRYRELYLRLAPARPPRVLIYADCPVFGGADVLTVHILQDEEARREFDLSYVHRSNRRFNAGLRHHLVRTPARTARVRFLERHELLDVMERHVSFQPLRYAFKALLRLVDYLLFPFEVLALLRAFALARPDLVHINNGGYPGALGCRAAAVAARLAGARKVVFGVNNLARQLRLPWELGDVLIDRLVISCCDVFVTASLAAREALSRRGFPKERIEAYPNGVREPRSLRPASEVRAELGVAPAQLAFAMIAYFELRKGHMVLVEAVRSLTAAEPALAEMLRFVLIADGPELAGVKQAVKDRGIERMFAFLGYRSDALDILNACDGLVLPSIDAEDMPVSILEAMALSKPVVASRLSGIVEEVEDGATGLLVTPGRVCELAEALRTVALDREARLAMGRKGKERFLAMFNIDESAQRYLRLYGRLLPEPGRACLPASSAAAEPARAAGR